MVRISRNLTEIDWAYAAHLIESAPLGSRDPAVLQRAFENSFAVSFAWDEQELVGLGRAISDGYYQAAIYDLVVGPRQQGTGVGTMLMDDLHAQLQGIENIILYAVPGKERFYRRFGYRLMRTAMAILAPTLSRPSDGYLHE